MNLIYFKVLYVHDLPWTYWQIGSKWVDTLMNRQTWQPYHEIINIKNTFRPLYRVYSECQSSLLSFRMQHPLSHSLCLSLSAHAPSTISFIVSARNFSRSSPFLSLSHSLTIPYVFPQSLILHVRATTSRSDASFALLRALTN